MGERGAGFKMPVGGKTSPDDRAILTMWKLRGPEPLQNSVISAKIPHDGDPVVFDLGTGKQSSNGNFRVILYQSPLEIKTARERFDWGVRVEMPGGGLTGEDDPYPYWAPAGGYQPAFEFKVSSNSPEWQPNLKKNFYIKNAQGQYGLMRFNVYPGRSPTGIEVRLTVNPSGSQNLEPAPAKQVP